MTDETAEWHAKIDRVVEAARKFVDVANEFWPDYPEALTIETLDPLIDAIDGLGDGPQPPHPCVRPAEQEHDSATFCVSCGQYREKCEGC